MNKKAPILFLVVLSTSLLTAATAAPKAYGSPSTSIYIDPSEIIDDTLIVNDTFTISVMIADIPADPGLVGLQFEVTWDSSILAGVSMEEILFNTVTPPGDSFNIWRLQHRITATTAQYAYTWQNLSAAFEGGYGPISGNHTVANITLKVVGIGTSAIDLQGTKLGGPAGEQLTHDAIDGYFQNTPPPPPAYLYVDPAAILNFTLTPCTNFTMQVSIANATSLYDIEFKLAFDPTILHATDIVAGDFVPIAVTPTVEINNTGGYVMFAASLGTPSNGDGAVAEITFHVEGTGKTTLTLYDTALANQAGQPLPYDTGDGSFNNAQALPGDLNDDNVVDIFDAVAFADSFGAYKNATYTHPRWNEDADMNGDQVIDIFDLVLIGQQFGETA